MNVPGKDQFRSWLALIRLPNLLTVPGDVLAGYVVAGSCGAGGWVIAAVAVVFLYAAGLIINDLVDVEIDRRERPQRPLPSGRVRATTATYVAGGLLVAALAGLGSHSYLLAGAGMILCALIFLYNFKAKHHRFAGAIVMGLCRAASVGLGVAACSVEAYALPHVWIIMVWWFFYIAAVSWLAARETQDGVYGRDRWWPLMAIAAGAALLLSRAEVLSTQHLSRAALAFFFSALISWQCALRLRHSAARHHPPLIGWLISALLPMQAGVLVLMAREPWILLAALLVLFCWPLNRWLAKSWAMS